NKITGILTPAGDVRALRQAIQELMENLEYARGMGTKAKEAAKAFAPEKFFEVVFRISEECAGGHRADSFLVDGSHRYNASAERVALQSSVTRRHMRKPGQGLTEKKSKRYQSFCLGMAPAIGRGCNS